jgi:RNA polymerase sigma-32 factor
LEARAPRRTFRGPIGEVISEGNVGLMQAVRRFEPDKGFKLATYAMWRIRASIQEYILRSWSLVKMGTTASQKKLFFNLRKAKSRISALDEGDLRADQVAVIAKRLGVAQQDVVDMNCRLGGDASLNTPLREDGDGEWQDCLVDESASQETILADREESNARLDALKNALACSIRASAAYSRRDGSPRTRSRSRSLPRSLASRASACARST